MIKIYNPIEDRAVSFQSERDNTVNLYVCGVTPYDVGHLGHALTYVFFDTVKRYLEFCGHEVKHIQNITDIDDGMIEKAKQNDISIKKLTEKNHQIYLNEMDALNVLRPDMYPLSSSYISHMINNIDLLIKKDFAYIKNGYVFFDHTKLNNYGHLSRMNVNDIRNMDKTDTMPDEPDELKRDKLDFLLWQPEDFEEASYSSPWSQGRPGWHIECSTMVNEIIGEQVTIHGGGIDLMFPHHECEIAQSESITETNPYCKNWMHVSSLNINGQKMSKSLGNLIRVSDLLKKGYSSNNIRMYLLSHHYRAGLEFDEKAMNNIALQSKLIEEAMNVKGGPVDKLLIQPFRKSFMDAMDDDFDTPVAIDVLCEIANQLHIGKLEAKTAIPTLRELSLVLGIIV
jgi:cysteinyl-tRNA synthetase